jgi:uncharacterized membrane-anchored protein
MENNIKPPLKGLIFSLIAVLWFFVIAVGVNEYTLYSGEELYLETAPVDPRDLLRGDYVTLRYAFESDELIQNYITKNNIQEGTDLYISFQRDADNKGSVSWVSERKPNSSMFLRVQAQSQSWWRTSLSTGIWKYFVPQGTGREIERIRGDMSVRLKVDSYGTAKIVDLYYQWSKLNPKTFRAP